MIARDLKPELFEILGFVDASTVFRHMTDAMRRLQMQRKGNSIKLILIQSWDDEINIRDKRALLYMVRANNLFQNEFIDEGQKYESLAIEYYFLQEAEGKKDKPNPAQ